MTQPRDGHGGSPSEQPPQAGQNGPGDEAPQSRPPTYPYGPHLQNDPTPGPGATQPNGPGYAAGPNWTPPGGSGGWPPGYGLGYAPGWAPSAPSRRKRIATAAVAAVLVLAGAGAGVGIGHGVWGDTPSSPAQSDTTIPNDNGVAPFDYGNGNGSGGFPGSGLPGGNGGSGSGSNSSKSDGSGAPSNVDEIADKVSPALVDINVTFGYQNSRGAGTGIVLTSDGEILTNNHVIDGATSISVTDVGNGKTYSAGVVGYDSTHDVAVLQLKNASGLSTAKIADSSKVTVGQPVVAVGNAGGVGGEPSSSGGSVTALRQSITATDSLDGASERLSNLIEVNADVEAGDSGGSLVDTSGEVIGIDTAASDQFSFQSPTGGGQGYAVPINQAVSIVDKIEDGEGSSTIHVGATAFLGVSVTDGRSRTAGAQIGGVLNGGAAQKTGLAAGDVITSLNGHPIRSATDLSEQMAQLHPGDKVAIKWTGAAGQAHSGTVELASGPPA